MRAKKSFGQHFLTSPKIAETIIEAAKIEPNEAVLEIGPGEGALTKALLQRARLVVAIEKDPELIQLLKKQFAKEIAKQKLVVVQGDVLRFHPSAHPLLTPRYALVANIPYYITGAILEKFLGNTHQPNSMTLLVQKEVAERITARDGKESVLSLSVKAYGTPRYVQTVKAGSFRPSPKVDSAILTIEHISRDFFTTHNVREREFFGLIKKGFAHKRKKLSSNLGMSDDALLSLGLTPNVRAEDLSLQDWKNLLLN